MSFTNTIFKILEEQNILKTTKTKPIVDAIKNRKKIDFYYSGPRKPKKKSVKAGYRVKAEPVAMGSHKTTGNLLVRAYIDDPSASKRGTPGRVGKEKSNYGWRTFLASRMSRVEVLKDETFDTPREKFNGGGDDRWGHILASKTVGRIADLPEKRGKRKVNFFTSSLVGLEERIEINYAGKLGNTSFFTTKNRHIVDHFANPFSEIVSNYFDQAYRILLEILKYNDLHINYFLRINANITHNYGSGIACSPHYDHDFPHKNLLIYLNQASGPTVVINNENKTEEYFHPKEDAIITFEGKHYHYQPNVGERRIVLVATYL